MSLKYSLRSIKLTAEIQLRLLLRLSCFRIHSYPDFYIFLMIALHISDIPHSLFLLKRMNCSYLNQLFIAVIEALEFAIDFTYIHIYAIIYLLYISDCCFLSFLDICNI